MDEGFVYAIKEKMEQDGITTKELGDKCGYVEETINRILRRNIPIRLEMAATIAANLRLSLDDICGIIRKGGKCIE